MLVDGEWTVNAGNRGPIRVKGNQHLIAMDFDTTAIGGKRVKAAKLVCSKGDQSISAVSLSTIAVPWSETESNGLRSGLSDELSKALSSGVSAASSTDATHRSPPGLGYPGGKFPAVTGGNAFTIVHQAQSELVDGWYHWDEWPGARFRFDVRRT